jgi:hypothetical protein
MLRRHIVSESEIAGLCRRIYQKHRHALDLIYEHRPDRQAELREFLVGLVSEQSHFILDDSPKSYIRFIPKAWDKENLKSEGGVESWTSTRRMLLFQFNNSPDKIDLWLVVGPGPEEVRQKLLDASLKKGSPFNPRNKSLNKK